MGAAVSESHWQQTRQSWGYRFDSILGYPLNIRLSKLDIYSSLYINQTYAWMCAFWAPTDKLPPASTWNLLFAGFWPSSSLRGQTWPRCCSWYSTGDSNFCIQFRCQQKRMYGFGRVHECGPLMLQGMYVNVLFCVKLGTKNSPNDFIVSYAIFLSPSKDSS
jgi:hypothetical protein